LAGSPNWAMIFALSKPFMAPTKSFSRVGISNTAGASSALTADISKSELKTTANNALYFITDSNQKSVIFKCHASCEQAKLE
jgi:hypothetical protein